MGVCASTMDILIDPSRIAPQGLESAQRLKYPQITYHGPLVAYRDKEVPIVGSFDLSDIASDNSPRANMVMALAEAVTELALVANYSPQPASGTRPAGRTIERDYPAGVLAIEGKCESLLLAFDRGDSTIVEPPEAVQLARLMAPALLMADQATEASINNSSQIAAINTTYDNLSSEVKANILRYNLLARERFTKGEKRAIGFFAVLAAAAFAGRYIWKKKQLTAPVVVK